MPVGGQRRRHLRPRLYCQTFVRHSLVYGASEPVHKNEITTARRSNFLIMGHQGSIDKAHRQLGEL